MARRTTLTPRLDREALRTHARDIAETSIVTDALARFVEQIVQATHDLVTERYEARVRNLEREVYILKGGPE